MDPVPQDIQDSIERLERMVEDVSGQLEDTLADLVILEAPREKYQQLSELLDLVYKSTEEFQEIMGKQGYSRE